MIKNVELNNTSGDTLYPITTLENVVGSFGKLDIYPIGSIYVSAGSTSPASLFGGTWEKLEGRFLLGTDSSHTLGSMGGEATHTLTIDEMPSHTHTFSKTPTFGTKGDWDGGCQTMYDGDSFYKGTSALSITATGGGGAHNNMPPYLAVNIWKRTA